MEEARERTLKIMQLPKSDGGLGWSYEKAVKWENTIYENLRDARYEDRVKSFLNNCFHVIVLENQGICF
tara:strand:- start:1050 stop:1256 length:207 start_codon:yes stop_codon:yes gene_type:complete